MEVELLLDKLVNYETGLPRNVVEAVFHAMGKRWKHDLLHRLKRGPMDIDDPEGDVSIRQRTEDGDLDIEISVDRKLFEGWIDDLQKEGLLTIEGSTLRGLGEFAQAPLSEIEVEVLIALNSAYQLSITPLGVRRNLEKSKLTTKQVETILEDLVRKGHVEIVAATYGRPRTFRAL